MLSYTASQKIIQLKKERAAMESAREQRMEQSFVNKKCDSPDRPGKSQSYPATPDRITSGRCAKIVTPPHSGFHNQAPIIAPIHVPSLAPSPFYHYGPPPPMPSSVPHSQSHPHSMSGPIHSHHHSMPSQSHSHHHSHIPGQGSPWMPTYGQQYHHHHRQHQYSYHQAPVLNKTNDNPDPSAKKSSNSARRDGYTGGNMFSSPMPYGGLGLNVNVNVNVAKVDETPARSPARSPASIRDTLQISERGNLTHDEAMRICNLMESPGKRSHQNEVQLNDHLLRDMPSFDFADHHSLSTEDGDMSRELSPRDYLGHSEDNFLDLIRSDLDYGEELFSDIL